MEARMAATVGALVLVVGALYVAGDSVFQEPEFEEDTEGGDVFEEERNEEGVETASSTAPSGLSTECAVRNRTVTAEELDRVTEEYEREAWPTFDERRAGSMVHDALNDARNETVGGDPLVCDASLRSVAREHSRNVAEGEGSAGAAGFDDGDGCDNPEVRHGRWLYQRNKEDWDGPPLDQRTRIIYDHMELVDDVVDVWTDAGKNPATDPARTRQGIGTYVNRTSRLVVVTQVVC